MALRVDRLSWKLGISVALLVGLALAGWTALVHQRSYGELVATTRRHAERETWLIRQALEHQMLDKDRQLLTRMVKGFARQDTIRRVMILDREGRVSHTSDPAMGKSHFSAQSPTCRVCHQHSAAKRAQSTLLEIDGGAMLRCVQPIPNRPACHGCHDAKHLINGIIIVDVPLEATRTALRRSLSALTIGAGAFTLALVIGIGAVFRRLVTRRLRRFESTARAFGQGELDARVEIRQHDALGRVEGQFNAMADALSALLDQIKEQQANLEKVMNSVDDGMVVMDSERRIVAANDAFMRRFLGGKRITIGHRCCDGQGSCFGSSVSCGDKDGCPTERCFSSGGVQMAIRRRVLADGSQRQEEVRSSPVFSEKGTISHVVEVWRDITDRRSAEALLADYQRMVSLGMLASGFSHELNTPLASISTCLSGLRRLLGNVAEALPHYHDADNYIRIAEGQVERCATVTRQFLDLARGKSLQKEIIDLGSCIEVVAGLCRHAAAEAGVKIAIAPCEQELSILANSSSVQQVLLNLAMNAIAASERGKTLTLRRCPGNPLVVEVQDEGRGIGPEELSHIFEPFYSQRPGGTGLGLFVSMNLARAWGGDIKATSTAGCGSTFAVSFPRPGSCEGRSVQGDPKR